MWIPSQFTEEVITELHQFLTSFKYVKYITNVILANLPVNALYTSF